MALINLGGSHESGSRNVQRTYNNTATTTPNIPDWWKARYDSIDGGLDANGMTADQRTAADYLRQNLLNNPLAGAYGTADQATADALQAAGRYGGYIDSGVSALNGFSAAAGASGGTIDDAIYYLRNQQNNGSHTLGHWFPGEVQATTATAANAPSVAGGTGAAYMGAYGTPLARDYVDAALADYDAGAAQGFNALRARSADAFGNKRTGVAEGAFMADAARGRGSLAADVRLKAFNTAAGLGQSDADRALAADTANAGNILSTNQFNARQAQDTGQFNTSLTDSRQKFDIGQAEAGDQRRSGVANDLIAAALARSNANAAGANIAAQGVNAATAGMTAAAQRAGLGAQGLNNAAAYSAANVGNANALGNYGNMTLQQLFSLLGLGQAGIGSTKTENGSETTNEQSRNTKGNASISF